MRLYTKLLLSLIYSVFVSTVSADNIQKLTVNEGMSINEMTCLYQDQGMEYLWVGTQHGLNRYDGHHIKTIYADREAKGAIDFVRTIGESRPGQLWVGTKQGIGCYDYYNNTWLPLSEDFNTGTYNDLCSYQDSILYALRDDHTLVKISGRDHPQMEVKTFSNYGALISICNVEGQLVVGAAKGLLLLTEDGNLQTLKSDLVLGANTLKYIKEDHSLWAMYREEWFRIPVEQGQLLMHEAQTSAEYLQADVQFLTLDYYKHNYYLGVTLANYQGVVRVNPKSKKKWLRRLFDYYSVNDILIDNHNNIWCTTWQSGLLMQPLHKSPFRTYSTSDDAEGLPSRLIRYFCEQDNEEFLLATETHGIVAFDAEEELFSRPYMAENSAPNSKYFLYGNILHTLKKDWDGRLWAGFHREGFNVVAGPRRRAINRKIEQYFGGRPRLIVDDILIDNRNEKVYFFSRHKVFVYDGKTDSIDTLDLDFRYFSCVCRDSEGQFWVGERGALSVYSADFSYKKNYLNELLYKAGLLDEDINCLYLGQDDQVWIGTYGHGLYKYNPATNRIDKLSAPVHSSFNIVFSIIEDDNKNVWLGTNNGLYCYHPSSERFDRYTVSDGIQDNQFNYNAAYKRADGELYFGGINGFTRFYPKDIRPNVQLVAPRFSAFSIGDQAVPLYVQGKLKDQIAIPYDNNSFEFRFYTPNYTLSQDYVYAYQLESYSKKEYITTASQPYAQFDNLPPGKYRLGVKVSRSGSEWSNTTYSPWIVVLQPWYKSTLAFLIYGLLFLILLVFIIYYIRQKTIYRTSLQLAQLEKEKAEDITAAKLRFFTDIAHEIRTPLTLIVGPLNDLLSSRTFDTTVQQSLTLMQKSSQRLMSLMDELLLFRKAEAGRLPLALSKHYVEDFVMQVCELYQHEMRSRHIHFSCEVPSSKVAVFDKAKMEKVLSNLISNALKFIPKEGSISVVVEDGMGLVFRVSDTGSGMHQDAIDLVFTRFYQNEKTPSKGFGIGLALSKRIVEAHQGEISITSVVGEGTTFAIHIPTLEVNVEEVPVEQIQAVAVAEVSVENKYIKTNKKGLILVVEDEAEIRQYIADIFAREFEVVQKENGALGWQYAKGQHPDLIITDHQMPQMDGVTMCSKLKKEVATSHIPIVLLSAFNEIDDQIKGLNEGADDYIGKPFDKDVLYKKITNILQARRVLAERFNNGERVDTKQLPNSERLLIEKVNAFILEELKNENLDVPMLCAHLKIGKTTLTEKLRSVLDTTPAEYIKKIKLQEAYRLLTQEGVNVSEAAFATGFSPGYFSTCFKKEFGVSPGKV